MKTIESADSIGGLRGALRAFSTEGATCARIVSDDRFMEVANTMLQPLRAVFEKQATIACPVHIEVECELGVMEVCIDRHSSAGVASAWTALTLDHDPMLACRIIDAIVAPWIAQLAPPLNPVRVRAVQPPEPGNADQGIALRIGQLMMRLTRMDARMSHALSKLMSSQPVSSPHDLSLQLPGHLRLLSRRYSRCQLDTVVQGDVLLAGPGLTLNATWRHGLGRAMTSAALIDFSTSLVHVVSPPILENEHPDLAEEHQLSTSMETLQVPVSFEIDTARLALQELSAIVPGSVIALGAPLKEARVKLLCHGQLIGAGQLVAVGDNLGIRIEKMYWKRDDAKD